MMNKWNIPDRLEKKLRKTNKCVFCNKRMRAYLHTKGTPGDKATFEHLDNNENNISEENIVMCCQSCNSRKGAKKLSDWLNSDYCKKKKINKKTIKNIIVRRFLKKIDNR